MLAVQPIDSKNLDVDPARGFLPTEDPLQRLPQAFDAWEDLAADLPKRIVSHRVRHFIDALPPFPVDALDDTASWRRAMMILSYLGHAYVWGDGAPRATLPAVLARPWYAVAQHQGRPPVLSYASYALHNWRRLDPTQPISLDNIALLQNFMGGVDEEWFILIHVDIEAKAAPAMAAAPQAQVAASRRDIDGLQTQLEYIAASIEAMYQSLARMPEYCDPYIYFRRVRPYIHGWKNNPATPQGVTYEGVDAYQGKPMLFRGETGAQSSIVPCLDAVLGVKHADDPLKAYLMEMRTYMPPRHRAFMEALETHSSVVRDVVAHAQRPALQDVYDTCVAGVEKFRALHLQYAAQYIFQQSQTSEANPAGVGTGGTPFMKYLKKHRDETTNHRLGSEGTGH